MKIIIHLQHMESRSSSLLAIMIISKRYLCLVGAALSTMIIYDRLHLTNMNHYIILGYLLLFTVIYFFLHQLLDLFLDKNLRIETDYVLIQGFLKSPIFILERNRQKMAIFRIESKAHSVFFKMEYNGEMEKGKYKELLFDDLLIKPNKEYFIGATQIKYVYKKLHHIESIQPEVIDFYDLKKIYCKSTIKEKKYYEPKKNIIENI